MFMMLVVLIGSVVLVVVDDLSVKRLRIGYLNLEYDVTRLNHDIGNRFDG